MSGYVTVSPRYTDFNKKEDVLQSFDAGKDFTMHHPDYAEMACNKAALIKAGFTTVIIRYGKRQKTVVASLVEGAS